MNMLDAPARPGMDALCGALDDAGEVCALHGG